MASGGGDLRLQWPFAVLMAGSSGSGKTTLMSKIVCNPDRSMTRVPERVLIYYSHDQDAYRELLERSPRPVTLIKGSVPEDLETDPGTLLIVDDLQSSDVKTLAKWFTVKCHHNDTSLIYMVQNLFDRTPEHRTVSLNASHIVLFKSPRDSSQIVHLAKQVYPKNPRFLMEAYAAFTQGRPHSYIVIDFKQGTDERHRLRSTLLPYDDFPAYGFASRPDFDINSPGQTRL